MMTWNDRKRPSARDMLQHPWIRKDGVAGFNVIEPEVLHRLRSFANMNAFKKHTLMVSLCGSGAGGLSCCCAPCLLSCLAPYLCTHVSALNTAASWPDQPPVNLRPHPFGSMLACCFWVYSSLRSTCPKMKSKV
jgi:hypothetical protein